MTEELIARHCSPALAGIKPANIVSCLKDSCPDVEAELIRLNLGLNSSGIYLRVLRECKRRVLVMVYRSDKLAEYLTRPEILGFMRSVGYSEVFDLEAYLQRLSERVSCGGGFPHEIGAFLGYPLHDIEGFINHKDTGCKLTGYWKVYENADEAKRIFSIYDACRRAVVRRVNSGAHLTEMFA